jgi:hypothetical protein
MISDHVSPRVFEQRVRNRIIDAVEWISEGSSAVRAMGAGEYFNAFYDWIDNARPVWPWPSSAPSTMTSEEVAAVTEVLRIVNTACDATPPMVSKEELIASRWPERIAPVAKKALVLFLQRGRFDEEEEEVEPTRGKR